MTRSEFDALIENPYIYAHMIGFDLLTPFHDNWINKLLWRDEDYTLQAHRDSYKTTCLIVAVTLGYDSQAGRYHFTVEKRIRLYNGVYSCGEKMLDSSSNTRHGKAVIQP